MGVAKKGRRKMKYRNQTYIWWIAKNEEDEDKVWLNIVSEDKNIILAYRVGEGDFFIVSKGRVFQGEKTSGCHEEYWYLMKEPPRVITPKFVYELIAWSVDGKNAQGVV